MVGRGWAGQGMAGQVMVGCRKGCRGEEKIRGEGEDVDIDSSGGNHHL